MEARDFVLDLQRWGLTQTQIAEKSGIPQPTISKIARGDVEDVLSRNYRSLEAVHREERRKQARQAPPAASGERRPTRSRDAKPIAKTRETKGRG